MRRRSSYVSPWLRPDSSSQSNIPARVSRSSGSSTFGYIRSQHSSDSRRKRRKPSRTPAQHPSTIALGLDRVKSIGHAQPARVVITVGGTNG